MMKYFLITRMLWHLNLKEREIIELKKDSGC
jgi:hypothetical protein